MESNFFFKELNFTFPKYIVISLSHGFIGSFIIIFKMLSRRICDTESEARHSSKITSSTKVMNLSTGTSTACQRVLHGCPLIFSINGIKSPFTPEIFPEIFPFNCPMSRMFVKAIRI